MKKGFGIGTKLLGAFLVLTLFSIAAAYITITGLNERARNDALLSASSKQINALLEMKNVSSEVDREVLAFEFVGSASTQAETSAGAAGKYRLLARLEELQKWERVYIESIGNDSEARTFIERIDTLRNNIIDESLNYIKLREQNADPEVTVQSAQKLSAAVVSLKDTISDTIVQRRASIAEIEAATRKLKDRGIKENLFITATTTLLAIGFGLGLALRIAGPLRKLRDSALRIAEGDLNAQVVVTSGDETGDLARAFNEMTSKLKSSHVGLEAQVQETEMKANALSNQVAENERSRAAILNLLEDIELERKKAEDLVVERTHQLSDEKARLVASINSLSFGFVIVDSSNKILAKNPALNKILEIVNEPTMLSDIDTQLQSVDLVASCKECVLRNAVIEHENISYGKKFLRIFCVPVLDQSSAQLQVIGSVVLIEDITEAKVMERSRDEFFAVASHELRTPLTAIRGNADMILEMYADKIIDKDMKEMLQDINSSSVRLIDVVNDFLEVSRLEQGKIEMKLEKFNPNVVIEKVMRDLKELSAQKGLTLLYIPPIDQMPEVMADKNRVEQVLVNFVGNSSKFTKAGSITISAAIEPKVIRIRVTDTGTGISEHNQSLLFRKFQQAGEQMLARDASQSTGLGLYICKLIITNMGGEIGLEKSELGKGSTFFFTVPLAV